MAAFRPRLIASLCLLLTIGGGFLMGGPSRPSRPPPREAGSASSSSGRWRSMGTRLASVDFYNGGTRSTPPATVEIRETLSSVVLKTESLALPPGIGPLQPRHRWQLYRFGRGDRDRHLRLPCRREAIPNPFLGTFEVFDADLQVLGVVGPALNAHPLAAARVRIAPPCVRRGPGGKDSVGCTFNPPRGLSMPGGDPWIRQRWIGNPETRPGNPAWPGASPGVLQVPSQRRDLPSLASVIHVPRTEQAHRHGRRGRRQARARGLQTAAPG